MHRTVSRVERERRLRSNAKTTTSVSSRPVWGGSYITRVRERERGGKGDEQRQGKKWERERERERERKSERRDYSERRVASVRSVGHGACTANTKTFCMEQTDSSTENLAYRVYALIWNGRDTCREMIVCTRSNFGTTHFRNSLTLDKIGQMVEITGSRILIVLAVAKNTQTPLAKSMLTFNKTQTWSCLRTGSFSWLLVDVVLRM